ncbi:Phosphate acyltransferase [Poriferisphaera corsica]|uniref:Phosphate acyltransferase n=1 Tax=Poriferisphaera corsica TaxID=2528020 RepID=A0A517YRP8_9BACT|nr:phosphate acyltransferase PlsX [Poriferisphaera corsica]QDU32887.1 Phosphate acyltransferase [Poriferisphaera corsica]
MRIAVDVMGGDNAPDAIITGCLDAIELLSSDDTLVLIGDQELIEEAIAERTLSDDDKQRLEIVGTTQSIGMGESPVQAIRDKPDSSLVVMGKMAGRKAGDKKVDVIISAGNTGACVAAAQMSLRRLPGVHRPGIAIILPTFHGPVVLCDVGANPEPRPSHLYQYAKMSAIYSREVLGVDNPRVALLSIGGEENKGNSLVKETNEIIKSDSSINYVGYCEGRSLFKGMADVVVCEGFTGNVVLKLSEGLSKGLFEIIAHEILEEDPGLAMQFEPVAKRVWKKHDYHEYGGAPLLGANSICMICHGSSQARTIKNAIRKAISYAEHHVNDAIVEAFANSEVVAEESA